MNKTLFINFIYTTTLLMLSGLIFDTLYLREIIKNNTLKSIINGLLLGFIGVAITINTISTSPAAVLDNRSVLLLTSGLFFGPITAFITLIINVVYSIIPGGTGVYMDVSVILLSAIPGIVWHFIRKSEILKISWIELFCFSLAVHATIPFLSFILPPGTTFNYAHTPGFITLFIYPLEFTLLGLLMKCFLKRKFYENKLQISEERLNAYFKNAPDGIFVANDAGDYIDVNPAGCRMSGYSREEMLCLNIRKLISPDDNEKARNHFQKVISNGSASDDICLLRKDGTSSFLTVDSVKLSENSVIGFVKDITERKNAEDTLELLNKLLKAVILQAPFAAHILQGDLHNVKVIIENSESKRIMGEITEGRDDIDGSNSHSLNCRFYNTDKSIEIPLIDMPGIRAFNGETVLNEEYLFVHGDGTEVYVQANSSPVLDKDGNIEAVVVTFHDITYRIKAEQALKRSIEEKNILLMELYHRTKNNMQVISSMLQLQSLFYDNNEVKQVIADTTNRIEAIALVHKKLYQSKDLSSIILKHYIEDLIQLLFASFSIDDKKISVIKKMDTFPVLFDIAIPCGLILNELITNSLKHAFKDDGVIEISLKHDISGNIEIIYKDNGVGFPGNFNFDNIKTLGLLTIRNIIQHQLLGDVVFNNGSGFICKINFNDGIYVRRV